MTSRHKNVSSLLRHRMTIQQEERQQDGAGGYTRTWKDLADVWAQMERISGREAMVARKLQSTVTHRVLLRFRDGVNAAQRLAYDEKYYNIRYVACVAGNREMLELLVEEGVA